MTRSTREVLAEALRVLATAQRQLARAEKMTQELRECAPPITKETRQ